MFDNARWQSLKLKRGRYLVPWDLTRSTRQSQRGHRFMTAPARRARGAGVLHGAPRLLQQAAATRRGRLPGAERAKAYRGPFQGVRRRSSRGSRRTRPGTRSTTSRSRRPQAEARRAVLTRRAARRGAQVPRDGRRRARHDEHEPLPAGVPAQGQGLAASWGLHNYRTSTARRAGDTRLMLAVPRRGLADRDRRHREVRGRASRRSKRAAAADEVHVPAGEPLRQAPRGCARRSRSSSSTAWFGEPRGARFDAGLVNVDGTPRKAFSVVRGGGAATASAKSGRARQPRVLAEAPRAGWTLSRMITGQEGVTREDWPRLARACRPRTARHGVRVIDRGQPLLRHPDPPVGRHAQSHGRGRGGRRTAFRGSDRQRPDRAGRRPARPRGGGVPAERHDVQRDRVPAPHQAGRRRGRAAPDVAPDHRRGGRAGGDLGRVLCPVEVRAGCSTPRRCAGTCGRPATVTAALAAGVVEQTTNITGGHVWPLEQMRSRCSRSRARPGCARIWTALGS